MNDTVDVRNAAPVNMVNIPLFAWFCTSQDLFGICSINSNWAIDCDQTVNVTQQRRIRIKIGELSPKFPQFRFWK